MVDRIYKVDKFIIPSTVRNEFFPLILSIMNFLKIQPGHMQSFILEQPSASDESILVTFVEWENKQAIEAARTAVTVMQRESGVNPQEIMVNLGVRAEMGIYHNVNT